MCDGERETSEREYMGENVGAKVHDRKCVFACMSVCECVSVCVIERESRCVYKRGRT